MKIHQAESVFNVEFMGVDRQFMSFRDNESGELFTVETMLELPEKLKEVRGKFGKD